ncbi:MAG: AraC family transcriptional regulator [Pseudomonadota bacterium]
MFRDDFSVAAVTYGRMGGSGRREIGDLVAEPFALDFAFLEHERTVVEHRGGGIEELPILRHTGGAVGCDTVRFLETDGPSEFVEVRPAGWIRREVVSDMRAEAFQDHERLWNRCDPSLSALAMRVRAHALGGMSLSHEELEERLRNAIARSLEAAGARPRPKKELGLDHRRVKRVAAYIDANLDKDLRLSVLADVAAVSRFHFARMFLRTSGMPVHAFVTSLRMDRAASALRAGASVVQAANRVGYASGHSFRSAFYAQFGSHPSEYAERVRKRL